MFNLFLLSFKALVRLFGSGRDLIVENIILRQQLVEDQILATVRLEG